MPPSHAPQTTFRQISPGSADLIDMVANHVPGRGVRCGRGEGQEWKSVFVLNVVDGCIPSDLGAGTSDDLEEERRLLYVAMTRAKDSLNLMVPQRFFTHGQSATGDRHVYAARTRFIPNGLLALFERAAWPVAAVVDGASSRPKPARIDVGARVRGMWK